MSITTNPFSPDYQPATLTKGKPLAQLVSATLISAHGWQSVQGWAQHAGLQLAQATNSANGSFIGVWRKKGLELLWWVDADLPADPAGLAAEIAGRVNTWQGTAVGA